MLLDVTQVSVISDFTLLLDFENGERRQFDMNRLAFAETMVSAVGKKHVSSCVY